FREWHPDLKAKWMTGLECCHAKALNCTNVSQFFQLLRELIDEYNIHPSNLYNMDEKGVQLGIGKSTRALIDHDQKTINHLENGDHELVTIIECIAADGTVLPPSVIFKAKKRNLALLLEVIFASPYHCIILLCLPPHTTHQLQPCNVGALGPKLENAGQHRDNTTITKHNFLEHYHYACCRALTPTTITAAFAKCGIWQFNPSAIEESAFE
ncbi:hypothetical protein HYDPIDRAFT_56045, partial [Hydnomerulius pinastri MD-312]